MATQCTPCPTSSTTLSTRSIQRSSCLCNAGFYGDLSGAGICSTCPANSYCVGGFIQFVCPLHTHSPAQSSVYTHCRCDAGYRCSYTDRRDVRLEFTFNIDSTSFLAQTSTIQAKLAILADVPVTMVAMESYLALLSGPPSGIPPSDPPPSANM